MPKAINIQRYLDAFHPNHSLDTYTLGEELPAKQANAITQQYRQAGWCAGQGQTQTQGQTIGIATRANNAS